jgi:serine/threonine-protein kinase
VSLRSYRLIAEIGRGGMANVYLAVALGPAGFNKLVVVKKTRRDLAGEGDILAMFLDEGRLAARMNHPNVVQTYEVGQDGERYFITMEYLDGQPYSRVLSRMRERMPLHLHLRVLADMLAGLHHAHELRDFDGTPLGVVHRDATPQNVFITYDGSIKVVDFGIAKALDQSSQTRTGVVKGKVTYMSPEQVRGEPLDRRSDVFAVGVMLWEAIAGRRMWDELPDVTVVHELMYDNIPALRVAAPAVPPELAAICDRALSSRREGRYATALEMQRDLEAWLARTGLPASARDVGELIAPAFENERARVRAVIESQLRDTRWTGVQPRATARDLPSIEVSPASAQLLSGEASGPTAISSSGALIVRDPPMLGGATPPPVPGAISASVSLSPTNSGAALPLPVASPAPSRSLLVPAVVGVVVSVAVVGLGVHFLVEPRAPATGAAASASATAKEAPAPDAVKLTVRPRPAEARIYLDGVLLSAGPFEGKVLRSDKPRVVRVEAEQHLPREEQVVLTSDLVLSFDLQRDPAAAPSSPRPVGAAAGQGAGDKGGKGGKRPRGIDSDSPYKP